MPPAKLNDTVTEGNSPVWLTCSGVVFDDAFITLISGEIRLSPAVVEDPVADDRPARDKYSSVR